MYYYSLVPSFLVPPPPPPSCCVKRPSPRVARRESTNQSWKCVAPSGRRLHPSTPPPLLPSKKKVLQCRLIHVCLRAIWQPCFSYLPDATSRPFFPPPPSPPPPKAFVCGEGGGEGGNEYLLPASMAPFPLLSLFFKRETSKINFFFLDMP